MLKIVVIFLGKKIFFSNKKMVTLRSEKTIFYLLLQKLQF